MNTLRSIFFVVWMYGLLLLMGLIWLPSMLLPRGILVTGINWWVALVKWGLRTICGVETEIRGDENLPDGPIIYAAKHQCMWDVFVPFMVMSDPAIIMKRELLWYPFLGWYALKVRMIPIDRAGTTKTLKMMVSEAKERSASGRQVVIFPEGTRAAPGEKTTYYAAGASALYKSLGVPIVPVATNAGLFWPAHGLTRTPGKAIYEILPPIEPGLKRKDLMQRLESTIEQKSKMLLAEAGQSPHASTEIDGGETA